MKTKVYRITYANGKKFTYGNIKELMATNYIDISYNALCNALSKQNGIWKGKDGVKVEKLTVRPMIIERHESAGV